MKYYCTVCGKKLKNKYVDPVFAETWEGYCSNCNDIRFFDGYEEGYKIFKIVGKEKYSFNFALGHPTSFHYKKGENTPIFGPFAVFEQKKQAKKFLKYMKKKVSFDNSKHKIKKIKYQQSNIKELWYISNCFKWKLEKQDVPLGTRFAARVFL